MIPLIDIAAQQKRIAAELHAAVARVLEHGQYILGPEVHALEQRLAELSGAPYVVSCSSGTDALLLALMAKDVGPGDAVFVPAFTFIATAEAPAFLGATPFFLDVDPKSYNIAPDDFARAIDEAKQQGLRPKAVIPVDLFGLPADYPAICDIADTHGIFVLSDCAQSFGSRRDNVAAGAWGEMAATSFFPAKPLGCYGDGGAVLCHSEEHYKQLSALRVHGQSRDYVSDKIGMTGRMDTIQAAILLEKIKIFDEEITMRNHIAARYNQAFGEILQTPPMPDNVVQVWAQYCLLAKDSETRAEIQRACAEHGIPSKIYYPQSLSEQGVFADYPVVSSGLPVTESLCQRIFAIPMHPYLDNNTQDKIIEVITQAAS